MELPVSIFCASGEQPVPEGEAGLPLIPYTYPKPSLCVEGLPRLTRTGNPPPQVSSACMCSWCSGLAVPGPAQPFTYFCLHRSLNIRAQREEDEIQLAVLVAGPEKPRDRRQWSGSERVRGHEGTWGLSRPCPSPHARGP